LRTPPALIALTPGVLRPEGLQRALGAIRSAAAAGLSAVLVREPELGDGALLWFAREVKALLCAQRGGWLGVHDRAHVALAAEADAVHLGYRSLAPATVRALVPSGMAVGLSTHATDETSLWDAADYLFHGPVRDTPSKRGLLEPVGMDGLAAAVARSSVPVFGIGGLRPADLPALVAAGAAGVAVLRGVLGAGDPGRCARAYLAALAGAR